MGNPVVVRPEEWVEEQEDRVRRYQALKSHFFETSGYGPSDLLSLNLATREALTRNGGHYRIETDGSITQIAGPSADPSERL